MSSSIPGWKKMLNADPTEWLLEKDNPSVRYFALMNILNRGENDSEVIEAKRSIMEHVPVKRILSKQNPDGYWGEPHKPYLPKYKSHYWQLMILSQLGVDGDDNRIRNAIEFAFQFQMDEGGFSEFGEEGARDEYEYRKKRWKSRGKTIEEMDSWVRQMICEMQMSCLTGNHLCALIRLGFLEDKRTKRALDWLVEIQNQDGGWLCPYWGAHRKDKHGCFVGTITPLDAFSLVPESKRSARMKRAIQRGAEFLLMHRLYKADHHDFQVIKQSWTKFSFPRFWYDVLRGSMVLTRLGYTKDERMKDALELLLSKQDEEGRWILESTPIGRMYSTVEKKGEPSKWITLGAAEVLKAIFG